MGERLPSGATPWASIEGLELAQVLELLASEALRGTFARVADGLGSSPVFSDGVYQATLGILWQEGGAEVVATAQRAAGRLRPLFEGARRPVSYLETIVRQVMPVVVANDTSVEWAESYVASQQ